eukprot:TRINITY_DN4945_c0_g2_i1.p6 TRINITY_DN4945_c0_g2~~TRINITY_DN4945_c0_g2_i1.p6  ORF type:complete len:116 (-),score=23.83 TRINITY_DN4945_c0_g2_i1:903-1250(-)
MAARLLRTSRQLVALLNAPDATGRAPPSARQPTSAAALPSKPTYRRQRQFQPSAQYPSASATDCPSRPTVQQRRALRWALLAGRSRRAVCDSGCPWGGALTREVAAVRARGAAGR